jgi:adenylate kinase family enzyme
MLKPLYSPWNHRSYIVSPTIVLLGGPGCGKGTLGSYLSDLYNKPTIESGVLLRAAKHKYPNLGSGKLVSDEHIYEVFDERRAQPDCAQGFILDGIPRTVAQFTHYQESIFRHCRAIYLDLPVEMMVKRMEKRSREGSGRSDDASPEARATRIAEFTEKTVPALRQMTGTAQHFLHLNAQESIDIIRARAAAWLYSLS